MPKKKAAPQPEPMSGYRVRPRYRTVVCDWGTPEDGELPFTATIRTNLTFDQLNAIPGGEGVTFAEIWNEIHPYVKDWNLVGENLATGAIERVPPPAEAGPEAFRALDAELNIWLIAQVRTAHLGGPERKNGHTPSGSTPEPGGDKS